MGSTNQKALFIGNGINRMALKGVSWGTLLEELSNKFELDVDLGNDLKPFPLTFEEMLHSKNSSDEDFNAKLHNLKSRISKMFSATNSKMDFSVHKSIMECGVSEIITTNYDYNLEISVDPDFLSKKKLYSLNNQESKHSLYRGYDMSGVKVRHIHGELYHNREISNKSINYVEESIMIGYEHYSDYFLKIQNTIYGDNQYHRYKNKEGVLGRILSEKGSKIWTDLFFTHDLFFIGFSLDFSETHLWWLLMQRQEIKRKFGSSVPFLNNEIVFMYPELAPSETIVTGNTENFEDFYKKKLSAQKSKAVTDILMAFDVKIETIPCQDYSDFYGKVIEVIRKT